MNERQSISGPGLVMGAIVGSGLLIGLIVGIAAAVGLAMDSGGGNGGSASGGPVVVEAALSEFAIAAPDSVPAGDVTFNVTNGGGQVHNLILRGGAGSGDIQPGASGVLTLSNLAVGEYELYCSIPGHADSGMRRTLTVTDGGEVVTSSDTTTHGGSHSAAELEAMTDEEIAAIDATMKASIDRFLEVGGKTGTYGNQPLEPTVEADGTKVFELTASIVEWEIEPGKFVEGWAYNGQIPGPWIKVDVGDKVKVVLHNELPMGTDIHFHGVDTPNAMDGVAGLTQDLVLSGETFTYEFVPQQQALGMYHAHHHGHTQVVNGLFSVFQVGDVPLPAGETISGIEIPADVAPVAEIPMVLNDAGTIGLSLNGKSFPATQPYVFNLNDWYVVHYFNEGLQVHPMHQHGYPGLVYAKDGIPLEHPYWIDTLAVAPGERYSVLYQANNPGAWVFHCHILNHVERDDGIFGMATATIVQDPDA